MKDYINIYLGKLANNADEATIKAYTESAAGKIASVVGWTASGDVLTDPSTNVRIRVRAVIYQSKSYVTLGVYTRSSSDTDWFGWAWADNYAPNWGTANAADGVYATIVKSVSGASWAIGMSTNANNPAMKLAFYQNADKRYWVNMVYNVNSIYNIADGLNYTYTNGAGIMGIDNWSVYTAAEKTSIIPAPDPKRGSYFVDVARLVSVTGSNYQAGDIYFADGAYYRHIGNAFLIRVA